MLSDFLTESYNIGKLSWDCFDSIWSTVLTLIFQTGFRSILVTEWLALPTEENEVPGLNPARGGIQLITVKCFIAQSLSLSHFHRLDMT